MAHRRDGGGLVGEDANPSERIAPLKTAEVSRRSFLGAGAGTAAVTAAGALGLPAFFQSGDAEAAGSQTGQVRSTAAFLLRTIVAEQEKLVPIPAHPSNGDELLYPNKIGNFSKGLPHDPVRGEVDPAAYAALIHGLSTGRQCDLEAVPLGCPSPALQRKLVNPLAGLAFDLEGTDPQQLASPPAPAFASAEEAGEIVENYWMALLRDVPFAQYDTHPLALAAAEDLGDLSDFRGPKEEGEVTPRTLFRADFPGVLTGPYLSQFWWRNAPLGAKFIEQRIRPAVSSLDYMTTFPEWLAVQNGCQPAAVNQLEPVPRYMFNGRDIAQFVHFDAAIASYQAYLAAMLVLLDIGAPFNPGNPYRMSQTQEGFGTFGPPHVAALLAEVTTRALKAVWFQKWFVHRRSRPEDFAGRVHLTLTGVADYPIHADVQSSAVLWPIFEHNRALRDDPGTFLLPMAYPEGSPLHPAYGEGHGTIAGACITVLKAFFDETFILPSPVVPDPANPTRLIAYSGPPLTVGGELNKLASNVALGREIAGVHWRSDGISSMLLGEQVAISILRDQRWTFREDFNGFTFTTLRGQNITV